MAIPVNNREEMKEKDGEGGEMEREVEWERKGKSVDQ